jgi:hypothetical protein
MPRISDHILLLLISSPVDSSSALSVLTQRDDNTGLSEKMPYFAAIYTRLGLFLRCGLKSADKAHI